MQKLNFPSFEFRFKNSENRLSIFDIIRKKFILLTPEEWVRQHVLHELIYLKKYPLSLTSIEKTLIVNGLTKRYDLIIYKPNGSISILVECKAPEVKIAQQTFDQIAQYNFQLRADYLYITNGMNHYFCQMDYENGKYIFLESLPDYSSKTD